MVFNDRSVIFPIVVMYVEVPMATIGISVTMTSTKSNCVRSVFFLDVIFLCKLAILIFFSNASYFEHRVKKNVLLYLNKVTRFFNTIFTLILLLLHRNSQEEHTQLLLKELLHCQYSILQTLLPVVDRVLLY
jgi:hypothetical protein